MSTSIDSLIPIFREIFENDNLQISEKTSASDIEEWDSLNHIYLVVAIEKNLSIKFTTQEIQSWQCVGDILHSINSKK